MTTPSHRHSNTTWDAVGFDPKAAKSPAAHAARGKAEDTSAAASRRHAGGRPLQNLHTQCLYEEGNVVCDSPISTSEDESMHHNSENATPPASPAPGESPHPPADQIGRLSLEHNQHETPSSHRGRGQLSASVITSKRSASTELPRPPGRQSPKALHFTGPRQAHRNPRAAQPKTQKRGQFNAYQSYCASSVEDTKRKNLDALKSVRPFAQSHDRSTRRFDSGCEIASRGNSIQVVKEPAQTNGVPATVEEASTDDVENDAFCKNERYPGLILQPDSSPISQDQLAAEVKGIYAGLVMVEAKCINIDATQAADPKSQLKPEQWQALIALHRTLLYEHHDFLMATQHPTATPALRGLATKYSMPARMWKHGIHAFLEVLRHRRPDSQDYMLSFIYLAYQMMALLFETVPSFTDTWIECLGDLARYRMAIEEEKEAHATWGGVAARWYTMASDRHPAIGRLYHHLGILERPSLRKLCFYAKSLTCVISFPNARDSLSTLCGPIIQDGETIESSMQSAEARIVTLHALNFKTPNSDNISYVFSSALDLLVHTPSKLRDFGAYLAITNTAGLFEYGSPSNILSQHYTTAINLAMQSTRPSVATGNTRHTITSPVITSAVTSTPSLETSKSFWIQTFDLVLRSFRSASDLRDSLAYVHVMLVCVHSLHSLRTRLLNGQPSYTFDSPVDLPDLPWVALAGYLNIVARSQPISARILEYARQGLFLAPERKEDARPLPEDYLIRGLIWVQFYFRPGWFDGQAEDDGRAIEGAHTQQSRAERVLWLGLYLAFHTGYLSYDVRGRVFSAGNVTVAPQTPEIHPAEMEFTDTQTEQFSVVPTPSSRSSMAPTSSSSSEDGFTIVKKPKIKQESPPSWAKVAAGANTRPLSPRKHIPKYDAVKIENEDEMDYSVC